MKNLKSVEFLKTAAVSTTDADWQHLCDAFHEGMAHEQLRQRQGARQHRLGRSAW